MDEAMHPVGRCACCGEGSCLWCRLIDSNDLINRKDDQILWLQRLIAKVVRDNYPDSVAGYCDCEDFGGKCIGCVLHDAAASADIGEQASRVCAHATNRHDEECDLVAGLSKENKFLRALLKEAQLIIQAAALNYEKDSVEFRKISVVEANIEALSCQLCHGTGEIVLYNDESDPPAQPCPLCKPVGGVR